MKLEAFFYMLLRDSLPAGEVERLAQEAEKCENNTQDHFSNLPLFEYATELAERLR